MFIRKHFCAFIRYLEEIDAESDGDLKNITSYMRKLETYLFRILSVSRPNPGRMLMFSSNKLFSGFVTHALLDKCLKFLTAAT